VLDHLKLLELTFEESESVFALRLSKLPSHKLFGVNSQTFREECVEFKSYLIRLDQRNEAMETHLLE
jgi:hypothetical protein